MARLPDLTPDIASATVAEAMHQQEAAFGYVFNSTKLMGYCPDIMAASTGLGQAVDRQGNIEASLRYLLYVRVAGLNGCPF